MASVGYHEPVDELPAETRDMHRALVSLMEELEAVDWYSQRAAACCITAGEPRLCVPTHRRLRRC